MREVPKGMVPKTRLDRLVSIRERSEDSALENLARAQTSLERASARLAGMRDRARADGRAGGHAEEWVTEELAHVRLLHSVRTAEGDLAEALKKEHAARAGYVAARRAADAARRIQEKKQAEIVEAREKQEQKALDELATLAFNGRRSG